MLLQWRKYTNFSLILPNMKKSLLYTRTGDAGTTSLIGGMRAEKNSPRVCAYGDLDELNSHLGLVQAHAAIIDGAEAEAATLLAIERTLFDLGAYLATPGAEKCEALTTGVISALEHEIDVLDSMVEPQRCFILPGGTVAAACAHIARTVCRRAERSIITLAASEPVDAAVLAYVNRLSDYLYVLARRFNALSGRSELKVM